MHDADGFALASQATGYVHQAASIARHQDVSPGALEAGDLFLQHGIGDFWVFHGKGAAKATALFCQIHGDEFSPLNLTDQPAWFLYYAEFAQQMARGMIRYFPMEHRTQAFDPQHMHEEFREFVGTGRDCAWPRLWLAGENPH